MTPMEGTNYGWVVRYSYTQGLVEANATYHGYDLTPYRDRCGFATMSPANLGHIGWFLLQDSSWYGPCLAVDVSALKDFYANVYVRHEVAEAGPSIMAVYGQEFGLKTYIYMGRCPPRTQFQLPMAPSYHPELRIVREGTEPPNIHYNPQQFPADCRTRLERLIDAP
jgi:hypothetical protein